MNYGSPELQPKKSVAIHIRGNNKQCETTNEKLNMGNITMPELDQATHLGIIRITTMKHNIQTNVDENITKARRSAYSLFGWVPTTHLQNLHNTSIALRYGAIITVLKTS